MTSTAVVSEGVRAGAEAPRRYIVGVVWYTPDEWANVKAVAVDPDSFEASFEEWAAVVENGIAKIPRYGEIRRVFVFATELKAWCAARGREIDSQARVEFVTWKVRQGSSAN